MIIRQYKSEDFFHVVQLLNKCNVEPPVEESDFNGFCIVAEDNGKIIGCLWALIGKSTQSYLDYFVVDPEYRKTNMGWNLLNTMDAALRDLGIHRYTFFVEPDNDFFSKLVNDHREACKVMRLRDLRFYRREIGE